LSVDAFFGPLPVKSEEVVYFENQKTIILNKSAQLSQDSATEEHNRKRLEDEVLRVGFFGSCSPEDRPSVHSHFQAPLDILASLRRQVDHLRQERNAPAQVEPPQQLIHITDAEKFAQLTAVRHTPGSTSTARTTVETFTEEIDTETDHSQKVWILCISGVCLSCSRRRMS
jgi:hypothetical protein